VDDKRTAHSEAKGRGRSFEIHEQQKLKKITLFHSTLSPMQPGFERDVNNTEHKHKAQTTNNKQQTNNKQTTNTTLFALVSSTSRPTGRWCGSSETVPQFPPAWTREMRRRRRRGDEIKHHLRMGLERLVDEEIERFFRLEFQLLSQKLDHWLKA
jgi:hypothetical protein